MKEAIDNCGDESRSSNPILNFVDTFMGDKRGLKDRFEHRNKGNQHTNPRNFSVEDFEKHEDFALEFDRSLRLNNHESLRGIHNDRYKRAQMYNHMKFDRNTNKLKSSWADDFEQFSKNDHEFQEFDNIYHSKIHSRRDNSWADEFSNSETYKEFDDVFDNVSKKGDFIEESKDQEFVNLASKFSEIKDNRFKQSNFFQLMADLGSENQQKQSWADDFSGKTEHARFNVNEFLEHEGQNHLTKNDWREEFSNFEQVDPVEEFDTFEQSDMVEEFNTFEQSDNMVEEFNNFEQNSMADEFVLFDSESGYSFSRNNPYLDDCDAFDKGLQLFKEGFLSEAILAFEGAVQGDKFNGVSWYYLGIAHAENDHDDLAIIALEAALQRSPSDKDILISLAVSYINEFNIFKPLECLVKWIKLTPQYSRIVQDMDDLIDDDFDHNHEVVTDVYLKSARLNPTDPDPDIQIGLALLFNLNRDISKSIDCLKAALLKRPDDYLLWNRLGACQANNGRCGEALESYFRALSIKPSFTRARANLGISFKTLKRYEDATKCFLGALATNDNAKRIWNNLIKTFEEMGRPDLVKRCYKRDLSLFDEFNF